MYHVYAKCFVYMINAANSYYAEKNAPRITVFYPERRICTATFTPFLETTSDEASNTRDVKETECGGRCVRIWQPARPVAVGPVERRNRSNAFIS